MFLHWGVRFRSFGVALWEEGRQWRSLYFFRRPVLLFLAGTVLVILSLNLFGFFDRVQANDPVHFAERRVLLTGIIQTHPDVRAKGCVYTLQAETLRPEMPKGPTRSARGKVLLYIMGQKNVSALPGDRVRVRGTINTPPGARVPGTFDYARYLNVKGVHSVIYTSTYSFTNLGETPEKRFIRIGWILKSYFLSVLNHHLNAKRSAVLSGLLLGVRPRFHPGIRRIFVESGTMHILVASGSNVAFVIGIWFLLARILFRLKRSVCLISSLPLVWIYVLMVGADAPIVRAGVMATVGIIAYLLAREDRAYNALALAALALLLPSPTTLFDVGFLMSFVTVFGLIYFLPPLERGLNVQNIWLRWMVRIAAATTTAQLWLFPIMAAVFKRFFSVGLLANMVVIPLAAGGLWLGLLLVAVDALNAWVVSAPALLFLTQRVAQYYVDLIISLVAFFADHPGISFWLSPPGGLWMFFFYLGCVSLVWMKRSLTGRTAFLLSVTFLMGSFLGRQFFTRPPETLTLHWLDLGRGNAVFIQTPEGRHILINPGRAQPYNSTERILMPFFAQARIKYLDRVLITHSDPEAVSGLKSLEKSLRVKHVGYVKEGDVFKEGKLKIDALPGSRAFRTQTPLVLTYEGKTMLLAHTLSLKTQRFLLKKGPPRVDLFQARFSGKLRWNEEFVRKYKPQILIETGYDSKKHPSHPPWTSLKPIVPQKEGWIELHLGTRAENQVFRRFLKKKMERNPVTKPPAWAHQATPPNSPRNAS